MGVGVETSAWAEVRSEETAVAVVASQAGPANVVRSTAAVRRGVTSSPVWPYLPSSLEPARASDLSASLLPPELPSSGPPAVAPLSAPEAAWLASLKLPDLPVRIDARVVEYLRFYRDSERGRAIAREWAARRGRFVPALEAQLEQARLPRDLVWLSMIESGHDPSIRSRAGALGLWQFMPATARLYGLEVNRYVDERHDPELSTLAALRFLADLRERFGSWELAMAAYNMGPGGLSRAIQKYNTNDYWLLSRFEAGIPWETTLYVPKIIATALVMNNQRAFGLADIVAAAPTAHDTALLEPGRTLSEVALATRVPLPELLSLNPHLVARRAPPANESPRGWRVHLPPGKASELSVRLAPLPARAPAAAAAPSVVADAAPTLTETAPEQEMAREKETAPEQETASGELPSNPQEAAVVVVPARRFHYTTRRRAFHDVGPSDTLAAVAARFHVTETELLLWNSLDRTARLQPGQVLQLFVAEAQLESAARQALLHEGSVLEAGSPEFYAYFEGRAGRVRLVLRAKSGDTLNRIGARYGIRPGVMERINQRSGREVLAAGAEVVVYVKPWRAAQIASAAARTPAPAPLPDRTR